MLQGLFERERATDLQPVGIIDIGSNSVRLVVYEGLIRSATPLFNEKVLCGLGRSVATQGKLGEDGIGCTLAALTRFRAIARILGVKNLHAIATAAVRESVDGPDFIARAEKACGTTIEILSGEKEATLAAQGIRMGFLDADGVAGDLGGGSLELIDISAQKLTGATTLPLGGLRLMDVTGGRLDKVMAITDAELDRVSWLDRGRGRPFYAVGGTWRALSHLHMEQEAYPLRVTHAYEIPTETAIAFCQSIRKAKKLAALPGFDEIARARRDIIPYGATVLERLLERLQPSCVIFSVFGIREGLLFSLMPEAERRKDPLLGFCEAHARLHARSASHAIELGLWTDPLFSADETEDERRLRHAACLVSDIGWRTHPDYRGGQSLNVMAHATFGGISHQGRIFLALALYFRHAGEGESQGEALSGRLIEAVSRRALRRARILGAAIRTAHMLSIGMPGIIGHIPIGFENTQLVLYIPKAYASLDGERLRRRFATLAEFLERTPDVRVG